MERGKAVNVSVSFPENWLEMIKKKYPTKGVSSWFQEVATDRLELDGHLGPSEEESLHRQLDELIDVHGVEEAAALLSRPRNR